MSQTHGDPGYDERELLREHEAVWRSFVKVGAAAVTAVAVIVGLLAIFTL